MAEGGYQIMWTPRYGVCYTYNTHPLNGSDVDISRAIGPGSSNGLSLVFNVDGEAYMANMRTEIDGIMVAIHENDQLGNLESEAITLSPGTVTNIGLSKTTFKRLERPYQSQCVSDFPPETPVPGGYLPGYSLQACLGACMAELIWKQCGCLQPTGSTMTGTIHYLFSPNDYTFCMKKDWGCVLKVYQDSAKPDFNDPLCNQCRLSCNENKYQVSARFLLFWGSPSNHAFWNMHVCQSVCQECLTGSNSSRHAIFIPSKHATS